MITVAIEGAGDAVERLRSFPDRLGARLATVAQRLGDELQGRVAEKLDGGVLQMRSGRLASSLSLSVDQTTDGIATRLGIDPAAAPYAQFQEFGFSGTESVRAHLREIKQAFGRAIAERQVSVRSYGRRVAYPAHSFLRTALDEIAPDILFETGEAVDDTVAES
jgi:hypothetical protein